MDEKEKIKYFLYSCRNYVVLHETDEKNKDLEHYFLFITKKDIKENYKIIHKVFDLYQKEYPLNNLSIATKSFMEINKNNFYYIYLDTLNKSEVFFKQNEELLKNNVSNILSKRILGELIDVLNEINSNVNKYKNKFTLITKATFNLIKNKTKI